MQKKERGAITVFLSLIMIVFLSMTLTLEEVMRIQLGYGRIAKSMEGAGQHVMADYNQALAKQYNLYALDETYNGYGVEELLTRVQDYLEYNLNPALLTGSNSGFFCINVEDVSIENPEYLTDEEHQNLMKQISEAVKYESIQEGIDFLKEQISGVSEQKKQSDSMKEELTAKAREEEEGKRRAEEAESGASATRQSNTEAQSQLVEDPRKGLTAILSKGLLYYITDGDTSLGSESSLEVAESSFFQNLDDLINFVKKQSSWDIKGDIKEKSELVLYLNGHFRNYFSNPNEYVKKNRCEIEYLVCGKSNDADNLNSMAGKIIAFRLPMNFAVAVGDGAMRKEALAVATSLVGITGIAPVITAVQYLLLAAWSYAETLLEMKGLLQGKAVAFIKSREQWNLTLKHIGKQENSFKNVKGGMDYEDYLSLFLAMTSQEDLFSRMLKVIQQNLQIENANVILDHFLCKFRLTSRSHMNAKYSVLPDIAILTDWYSYEVAIQQQY